MSFFSGAEFFFESVRKKKRMFNFFSRGNKEPKPVETKQDGDLANADEMRERRISSVRDVMHARDEARTRLRDDLDLRVVIVDPVTNRPTTVCGNYRDWTKTKYSLEQQIEYVWMKTNLLLSTCLPSVTKEEMEKFSMPSDTEFGDWLRKRNFTEAEIARCAEVVRSQTIPIKFWDTFAFEKAARGSEAEIWTENDNIERFIFEFSYDQLAFYNEILTVIAPDLPKYSNNTVALTAATVGLIVGLMTNGQISALPKTGYVFSPYASIQSKSILTSIAAGVTTALGLKEVAGLVGFTQTKDEYTDLVRKAIAGQATNYLKATRDLVRKSNQERKTAQEMEVANKTNRQRMVMDRAIHDDNKQFHRQTLAIQGFKEFMNKDTTKSKTTKEYVDAIFTRIKNNIELGDYSSQMLLAAFDGIETRANLNDHHKTIVDALKSNVNATDQEVLEILSGHVQAKQKYFTGTPNSLVDANTDSAERKSRADSTKVFEEKLASQAKTVPKPTKTKAVSKEPKKPVDTTTPEYKELQRKATEKVEAEMFAEHAIQVARDSERRKKEDALIATLPTAKAKENNVMVVHHFVHQNRDVDMKSENTEPAQASHPAPPVENRPSVTTDNSSKAREARNARFSGRSSGSLEAPTEDVNMESQAQTRTKKTLDDETRARLQRLANEHADAEMEERKSTKIARYDGRRATTLPSEQKRLNPMEANNSVQTGDVEMESEDSFDPLESASKKRRKQLTSYKVRQKAALSSKWRMTSKQRIFWKKTGELLQSVGIPVAAAQKWLGPLCPWWGLDIRDRDKEKWVVGCCRARYALLLTLVKRKLLCPVREWTPAKLNQMLNPGEGAYCLSIHEPGNFFLFFKTKQGKFKSNRFLAKNFAVVHSLDKKNKWSFDEWETYHNLLVPMRQLHLQPRLFAKRNE